ncbi:MAG: phage tail assembly chaperone [Alphaproteobacteria bacterium]|nr:phage tail assembly chaperone [Alphaproteobacteria bacterium]
MATKAFLGETVAVIGKRICGLRPSFAALHAIEAHTHVSIPQVIAHIDSPSCHAEVVRHVLEQGILAYDADATLPKLRSKQWLALRETAVAFLIQGLGCRIDAGATKNSPAPTVVSNVSQSVTPVEQQEKQDSSASRFEPLDWQQVYKTATGLLGKTEDEFWQMTYPGLMLQCEAHAAAQGIEIAEVGHPATPDDLLTMMQQYPDSLTA